MTKTTPFPMSFFGSVRENTASDFVEMTFDEFADVLRDFSTETFDCKSAAPLFAATHFQNNHRRKSNATQSGLIVLDIDDGCRIEEIGPTMRDLTIAGLLYTTASHRAEQHKFRLCLPLSAPVSYDLHVACWHAVNHTLINGVADFSKVGCESLFYMPGIYPQAPGQFLQFSGNILSAEEWIEFADLPPEDNRVTSPERPPKAHSYAPVSPTAGRSDHIRAWELDIHTTSLVPEKALNKYLSLNTGWHTGRFSLILAIAQRARHKKVTLTASDIVYLFNQIDQLDGGHYQTEKYQQEIFRDAKKALE